jgi:hypothetical protein
MPFQLAQYARRVPARTLENISLPYHHVVTFPARSHNTQGGVRLPRAGVALLDLIRSRCAEVDLATINRALTKRESLRRIP